MKLEATHSRHRDRVSFALAAIAVLLGALVIAKVASYFQVQRIAAQVRRLGGQDANDLQESLHKAKEAAQALKKSNLFIKTPPKEHPVKQVDGILGSEVLIAQKWYKVGDKVGEAKIVAVLSTAVKIEWDGKEKTFAPLAAAVVEPPATPPAVAEAKVEKPPEPTKGDVQAAPVEVKVVATAPREDPLAWMGVDLPPRIKEKLLEYWNKMPSAERERAKEEWNKMSPEDKDKAIDAMEQQL